ncbi:MarR family winged helix-turn-helix transcriptional regulator [Chromobacterium alticapitis]|nr:MarR family transcriptional regulator [Chromobacterium alticapitis]
MDSRLQACGITRSQRQILLMLYWHGDCTQKNLLLHLDMDPGQLARTLDGLEKDGYVKRSPWGANRRCLFVELTERCREERMPQLLEAVESVDSQLFQGFDKEEQMHVQKLLDRLQANLQSNGERDSHED